MTRSFFFSAPMTLAVLAICGSLLPTSPVSAGAVATLWSVAWCAQGLSARCPTSRCPTARCPTARSKVLLASFTQVVTFQRALLLLALLSVPAVSARAEVRNYQREYVRIVEELDGPKRCSGRATIVSSPTVRTEAASGESVMLLSAQATELDCEGTRVRGPLHLRLYCADADVSGAPLGRGDEVTIIAGLAPVSLFRNAALQDPFTGAARRGTLLSGNALHLRRENMGSGAAALIDKARGHVRTRITATFHSKVESLARALVLGESDLRPDDAEAFRDSGLLHLLAVSGTHLVIAVFALVQGLRALLVRIGPLARRYDVARVSAAFGAFLSLLYADFSGGSGSAWRAAWMLCVVCGGRSLGLRVRGAHALASSLLLGLLVDPLAASDFSFLLSALATSGLIALGQPLTAALGGVRWIPGAVRGVLGSFIATVSSTIPCAPVLSMMDGDMTLAALFANVLAGPLGELIALPACLLHAVSSSFPGVEKGLAILGSGALIGVREVALWSGAVKEAQFQVPLLGPAELGSLVGALCLLGIAPSLKKGAARALGRVMAPLALVLVVVVTLGSLALRGRLSHRPSGLLRVTALDVGQGDALALDFPDGKLGFLDGGGFVTKVPDTGERVLLPYLRARGRSTVDLVALSHAHPDHLGGLLSLAKRIPIVEVWLPGEIPSTPDLREFLKRARALGARVRSASELCAQSQKEDGLRFGGVKVEVLAPCTVVEPPLSLNDGSLVLRLGHGNKRALLTGDIEKQGEALLLESRPQDLKADLLKVAHHGSDTSSDPDFVRAVGPEVAVISSGVRNRFKHPRPKTLQTMAEQDIPVLRTDQLGGVTWSTNGTTSWLQVPQSSRENWLDCLLNRALSFSL